MFLGAGIIAWKTPKRKLFWLRAAGCFAVFCVLRWLYFSVLSQLIPFEVRYYINMIGFAVLLLLLSTAVVVCFDCDVWTGLFCGSTSYSAQHVCQRSYMLWSRLLLKNSIATLHILLFVFFIILTCGLLFLIMRKLKIDKIVVDNKYLLAITVIIVMTSVVLDLISFRALQGSSDLLWCCIHISSIFISALILTLQISMVTGKKVEIERDTVKEMLESEREQYYFEKSMIDIVNIRVHDLKHRLSKEGLTEEEKKEVESAVKAYDSSFKTGNTALDVVLTRKNFACRENGIELTCAAQGDSLGFMSEADVYSLFGNILDNAIEASEKLEDKGKRVISLSIRKNGYFVSIHAENYFAGKLNFSGGLPQTTKKDAGLHGYGLKSIGMLVDKYGGSMKVGTKEDRFFLDIMLTL